MELIKISDGEIGGAVVQTVNARDLHEFLEIGKDFSTWIKLRVEQFGFVEGADYLLTETGEQLPSGTKYRKDYFLTLDMAKELSMVERNARGKQARQYFLECERRVKSIDPMKFLSDPAAMRGLLLTYTEKVIALEAKVEEQRVDVEALNTIAKADGSLCITDAAKALQLRPKDLFAYLRQHGWIYRRAGAGHDCAYQTRIQAGDLEHKVSSVLRADGSEKITEQVRVTPQGLAKLAKLFPPALRVA